MHGNERDEASSRLPQLHRVLKTVPELRKGRFGAITQVAGQTPADSKWSRAGKCRYGCPLILPVCEGKTHHENHRGDNCDLWRR